MAITKIEFGSIADPEIINNNFEYLDEKVTDTSSKIYTNNADLEALINSQVLTLTNNLNDKVEVINSDIKKVEDSVAETKDSLKEIYDWITPDYKKGVDAGATFTAPSYGVVMITFNVNNSSAYITVNGTNVARYVDGDGVSGAVNQSFTIPVAKGDVVKRTAGDTKFSRFFPYKGQ